MEKRQFLYVRTVAECGSITRAAQKLFISQPALSNYISRTEEELGAQLIDRSTLPLSLTYAGEQYLEHGKAILLEMENLEKKFRDISNHFNGKLRIGFPHERVVYMLPQILPEFNKRYPGIKVEVITGSGNHLVEALRTGDIDFFFLPMWEQQKDLAQVKISEEELFLVTARGYLDDSWLLNAEKKIFDWNRVGELPLITLKKGHVLRKSIEVLLKNKKSKPNIFMEIHSNMLAYQLAAKGLGVAVVPEITLRLMEETSAVDCYHLSMHPVIWEIFAVYRKAGYFGEVEKAFLDIAVQTFKK